MNLFDMNSDKITMNIDGKDMEMKPAICFGKVYDKWLVSKCGKVWSMPRNKLLQGFYRKRKINFKYTNQSAISLKICGEHKSS